MSEFKVGDFVTYTGTNSFIAKLLKDDIGMIWSVTDYPIINTTICAIFYAGIPHRGNADKLWYFYDAHIVKV